MTYIQELHSTLAEELDFEHEGENLEKCGRDLSQFRYVHVPQVKWKLSSKRVLTAEWIDGCRVTDKAAIAAMGLDVADVSEEPIKDPGEDMTPYKSSYISLKTGYGPN